MSNGASLVILGDLTRPATVLIEKIPDTRAIRVSVLREHDGQAINKVVNLRRSRGSHSGGQDRSESLKSRL